MRKKGTEEKEVVGKKREPESIQLKSWEGNRIAGKERVGKKT